MMTGRPMDFLSQMNGYLPYVSQALTILVCAAAARRRLWRMLPFVWWYLVLVLLFDAVRWFTLWHFGQLSAAYSWTYWVTQVVLVFARCAALADVCRAALGQYPGVWRLARLLFVVAIAVMLALEGLREPGFSYVMFFERELEFAAVAAMFSLLLTSTRYEVSLPRSLKGIVLGLAINSIIVIMGNSIISAPLTLPWEAYWKAYGVVRVVAFIAMLSFWLYALWLPVLESHRTELGPPGTYEENAPLLSAKMRYLNDRLTELIKL